MKEKIIAAVDGIRCAERKLAHLDAKRERLQAELRELESAVAYQEKAKRSAEHALNSLMGGADVDRSMLNDQAAHRVAVGSKIARLEAENCI